MPLSFDQIYLELPNEVLILSNTEFYALILWRLYIVEQR